MSCIDVRIWYIDVGSEERSALYVCNCNGIREREVRAAIDAGAQRPADVFRACDAKPRCARCVCEMREMISEQGEALRYAAE
jgi:bacterioferritin-associated ferredoxin